MSEAAPTSLPPAVPGSPPLNSTAPIESKDLEESTEIKVVNPLDALSQDELKLKLEQSRKDLKAILESKKKLDFELGGLESSIYAFETCYLQDQLLPSSSSSSTVGQFGNIIKGYDSFLKAPAATAGDRKRGRNGLEEVRELERIFSRSSSSYQKAVETRELIPNRIIHQPAMINEGSDSEEEFESRGRRRRKTQNN